jgi:hypothetical protein
MLVATATRNLKEWIRWSALCGRDYAITSQRPIQKIFINHAHSFMSDNHRSTDIAIHIRWIKDARSVQYHRASKKPVCHGLFAPPVRLRLDA